MTSTAIARLFVSFTVTLLSTGISLLNGFQSVLSGHTPSYNYIYTSTINAAVPTVDSVKSTEEALILVTKNTVVRKRSTDSVPSTEPSTTDTSSYNTKSTSSHQFSVNSVLSQNHL